MAIDLSKIKSRLATLKTTNNKTTNLWKPEPGTQTIRIIPYIHNKENPFLEMHFHYDFGGKTILSPITFGRPDPIVEFAEKLKSTGAKEDWQLGKKLEPKMRTYVPILVRGKESEGVKFWGFGKTVYQELLNIISDADYGDITDPTAGRDVKVTFKTAEEAGKSFPETSIMVKPNTSAATDDTGVLEKIKAMPKITDIFKEPTYEDLTKALESYMNGTPEEGTSDTSKPANTNKDNIAKESKPVAKVSDVNEAFNDLFNK